MYAKASATNTTIRTVARPVSARGRGAAVRFAGPVPTPTVRRVGAGRARVRVCTRVVPVVRTRDEPVRRVGPCPLGARRCVVTLLPRSTGHGLWHSP
ncbi:hypothetical protein GCM10010172_13070 [Paractinoplanes ferrugineus]|uniref:Uncharacterized protein n=1 Tax=Paractinoplanes ferrugineus TaxID=113564 RepID=A0A919MJ78_9ACTN|nr:hypothetical protein Afe05nite_17120 [Actinoplanes ferrugineus]